MANPQYDPDQIVEMIRDIRVRLDALQQAVTRLLDQQHVATLPLLLSSHEVAKALGIGRTKAYEMMASGELPAVHIGTGVRVPRDKLLKWMSELR